MQSYAYKRGDNEPPRLKIHDVLAIHSWGQSRLPRLRQRRLCDCL